MKCPLTLLICLLLSAASGVPGEDKPNKSGREGGKKHLDVPQAPSSGEDTSKEKSRENRKTNGLTRGDSEKRREQLKRMSPEERLAKRKEIRERLEKRVSDLRARKANGSLSAQEGRELERREEILKRFDQESVPRNDRPKTVLTNAPKRSPDKFE